MSLFHMSFNVIETNATTVLVKIKLASLLEIASSSYLSTYPDFTESNFVYAIIPAQGHVET
jgi:hypothetical protein